MEDDNDLEQVSGSPTAGENEFVHVESVDSAQTDAGSVNQVERIEQDDGVMITGVDTVQDEPHDAISNEDGGQDEFVDCPDDLISNESKSPGPGSMTRQQPFGDDTEDVQYNVADNEKEITPHDYEEERRVFMKEVSNLHHQLKALSNRQSLVDENDVGDSALGISESDEKSNLPLSEMVNECSKYIEYSTNERLQSESTIKELYATLHMKDKEIEDLTIRVKEQSKLQDAVDRILSSLVTAFGGAELSDTSVNGKLYYLEEGTSYLLTQYNYFLSEVNMLAHCMAEVKSDFPMENYMEMIFPSLREELIGLKQKELEFHEKNTVLTKQLEKNRETIELLNAEIVKLKGEVEQEKTRYTNTKEKLSMAVTKGKALVQQRDSLKQMVAEKSSELERCLVELQEKSTELTQTEILANSLQEALTQRDAVIGKFTELLCQALPEVAQAPDLEYQLNWLLESYNLAKDQSIKLHDENNAMKEAASAQIDYLTASLLVESQEKYHLKEQLEEIACKSPMDIEVFEKIQSLLYTSDLESKMYERILELELDNRSHELHASKDELNFLQMNLQRSEEKASLLREKLSMAVKKGKGLVQERENMKKQMAEKNVQIEALMVDFRKQESTLSDYRDQVAKLESERDQIGQFLAQSNMMLQDIIEIIDGISVSFSSELKEPVEKVKWFAAYVSECQIAKDEAGQLISKLTEALVNMKSLEDALSVSEQNVSQLSETKRELEVSKIQAEQEVEISKEEIDTLNNKLVETLKTVKSLEDNLAGSQKTIGLLTEEKSELEIAKCHIEEELHKAMNEITFQTSNLDDAKKTIKSLEDALSVSEQNVSQLSEKKRELEASKTHAEQEVETLKEEIDMLNNKLVETLKTVKSMEDKLAGSQKTVSLLTEEKSELEIAKCHVEEELRKAMDEITSQTSNISMLMSEKEEAQMEVQRVKEEVSFHASNLDDAKKTIKSLEETIFQLNTNVSQCSQENEKAVDNTTVLESEIKKLKEEAEHEISTLKTELAAVNDKWGPQLSGFVGNLMVLLKDESLFSLFKQSFEKKIESLKDIDRLLKDMKDSFDIEQLQDHPAIEENFQSPTFLFADFNYDWNTGMINDEFNPEDIEGISSYVSKTFDNLNTKNQIIANQFGNYSTLIDDIIASLLKKLEAIRNTIPLIVQQTVSLQQKVENVQMEKEMQDNKVVSLENGIKVLVSACADVTKDLKSYFENNMLQADPTIVDDDVAVADVKDAAADLLFAARNVQSVMEQLVGVKENMSTTIESLQTELKNTSSMYDKSKEVIEELQIKLEKTSSMYDKSKEVIEELSVKLEKTSSMYDKAKGLIEELQGELEKTGSMYGKVKEENDAFQKRVFKLETELEASRESRNEMSSRLEDYRAKEDRWNERESELSARSISSVKDHEDDAEKALLSASQIKTLFDKIDGITIPFPNLVVGDKQAQDSNPVEKLFYIVDNVNELLDQLTLLTHANEDLQSTVSKQALEVDHLKGEYRDGLQNIIRKLGGEESIVVRKPADVAGLVLVLEELVQGVIMDGQDSKSKLVETQIFAEELSRKVKLMEDLIQNRTGGPDMIQERGVIGATSYPSGSEISEIDDQVTVGKVGLPLVPSAAQMRSLRKSGSSEQLAITIDSESDRLLDKAETVEDKGHIFKSLHTSGLVPVQGKMIADRLDGLWVSGGQALMRQPRARLGLIAYWLMLHLWLLGTIL